MGNCLDVLLDLIVDCWALPGTGAPHLFHESALSRSSGAKSVASMDQVVGASWEGGTVHLPALWNCQSNHDSSSGSLSLTGNARASQTNFILPLVP